MNNTLISAICCGTSIPNQSMPSWKISPSFFCYYRFRFFVFGEEGREGEPSRDNIPCNSLADAANLPCARSHSNALKLDAVLVDQCFTQCFVARREEKRRERRERGERARRTTGK